MDSIIMMYANIRIITLIAIEFIEFIILVMRYKTRNTVIKPV